MATDAKSPEGSSEASQHREHGVRIFTYPKIIFIFPTLITAVICWISMIFLLGRIDRPSGGPQAAETQVQANADAKAGVAKVDQGLMKDGKALKTTGGTMQDFKSPQNIIGVLFLGVFTINLLILALDFPRFTIVAGLLLATTATFFLLWLGMFFDLLSPLMGFISGIYVVANDQFYFMIALVLTIIYAVILTTRWLDYWEILPNEILHHHGPLSDLERFPTMNLKFDKEIPDVLEHFMFGAGRLVLHVQAERKSIVLDNVLRINVKEEALKKMMSRLEVRVTTDQEIGSP